MSDSRAVEPTGPAPRPQAPPPLPVVLGPADMVASGGAASIAPLAPAPVAHSAEPEAVERSQGASIGRAPEPYWNSYAAGVALGLVLLTAFVVTGRGVGASGAVTRMGALTIQKIEASARGGTAHEKETFARANPYTAQYINDAEDPLDDFLVYVFIGLIAGGFLSGLLSARTRLAIEKGPHTTARRRLALAMLGGFISAFGARLARGCTSGQALTGGATLAVGSWVFMMAVFAGGYALAYFVRKEWL
jgi:uncharacterized protein